MRDQEQPENVEYLNFWRCSITNVASSAPETKSRIAMDNSTQLKRRFDSPANWTQISRRNQ